MAEPVREPDDDPVAGASRESGVPFVIVDFFRYKLTDEELELVDSFSPKRFGPLLVCELPEPNGTETDP